MKKASKRTRTKKSSSKEFNAEFRPYRVLYLVVFVAVTSLVLLAAAAIN